MSSFRPTHLILSQSYDWRWPARSWYSSAQECASRCCLRDLSLFGALLGPIWGVLKVIIDARNQWLQGLATYETTRRLLTGLSTSYWKFACLISGEAAVGCRCAWSSRKLHHPFLSCRCRRLWDLLSFSNWTKSVQSLWQSQLQPIWPWQVCLWGSCPQTYTRYLSSSPISFRRSMNLSAAISNAWSSTALMYWGLLHFQTADWDSNCLNELQQALL